MYFYSIYHTHFDYSTKNSVIMQIGKNTVAGTQKTLQKLFYQIFLDRRLKILRKVYYYNFDRFYSNTYNIKSV